MAEGMMEWIIRDAREKIEPGLVMMDGWGLKELLGKGAFADVWRAEKSIIGIRDQSAIKIIRIPHDPEETDAMLAEGFSESDIRTEFRQEVENAVREIRAMVDLQSNPAMVPYKNFDVIQFEEDGTWEIDIRMQLLTSLPNWIRARETDARDVIRMGISLTDLLSACEKKNILHRDIKPANIFVDELDSFRLGDFGLSRVIADSGSAHSRGVGTEAYMAPEVFRSDRYDHRADIYSLGLVMYWMLNGQNLPFANKGFSRAQAVARRLAGEPLPALPGVDPALDRIVRRACEPDPEKRWKTAQDFHDALVRYRNEQSNPPRVYEEPKRQPEPVQHRRTVTQSAGQEPSFTRQQEPVQYKKPVSQPSRPGSPYTGTTASQAVRTNPSPVKQQANPRRKHTRLWLMTAVFVFIAFVLGLLLTAGVIPDRRGTQTGAEKQASELTTIDENLANNHPNSLSSRGYVTVNGAILRSEPGIGSNIIRTVYIYELMYILNSVQSNNKTWFYVSDGNQYGYISEDYFRQLTYSEAETFVHSEEYTKTKTAVPNKGQLSDAKQLINSAENWLSTRDKVSEQYTAVEKAKNALSALVDSDTVTQAELMNAMHDVRRALTGTNKTGGETESSTWAPTPTPYLTPDPASMVFEED